VWRIQILFKDLKSRKDQSESVTHRTWGYDLKHAHYAMLMGWLGIGSACADDPGSVARLDAGPVAPVEVLDPWFCSEPGHASSAGDDAWQVQSDHYSLYAETSQAEALILSALIEASWDAMSDWFEDQPELVADQLFRVELYADVDAWAAAIRRDGLEVPQGAGGYFHPGSGIAYAYQQPTRYYTRQLVLHEAIHQFHDGVRSPGHRVPGWYIEGLAEHLSHYDWNGECLRLGRLPMVTQEDSPAQALDQPIDLASHWMNENSVSRPLEWATFRYFEHADEGAYADRWRAFVRSMDAGSQDALAEFERIFEVPVSTFDEPIQDWLTNAQQPLKAEYLEWSHVAPGGVDGWSSVFSFARIKNSVQRFSMTFEPAWSEAGAGGVLLSYQDPQNWVGVVVGANGRVSSFEMREGQAVWWDQGEAPALIDGAYSWQIDHGTQETTVQINDQTFILPLDFEPAGGPALNQSSLRFSEIEWTP